MVLYGSRIQPIVVKVMTSGTGGSWSHCMHSRDAEGMDASAGLSPGPQPSRQCHPLLEWLFPLHLIRSG